ncbi:MAG: hypothetical protein ABMB14_14285 [Myxococcota bacterium]
MADAPAPLYDPAREPAVDPRDAVVVVHRFLARCAAWGREREIPARIERLRADPTPEQAAKLHAWVTWVAFVDHALREVEGGDLDPWFTSGDGL